jgi:hypothetical protein
MMPLAFGFIYIAPAYRQTGLRGIVLSAYSFYNHFTIWGFATKTIGRTEIVSIPAPQNIN